MNRTAVTVLTCTLLLLAAPARADSVHTVKTLEDVAALPPDARRVRVSLADGSSKPRPSGIIEALVARAPDIDELTLSNPGNKIETRSLELLSGLKSLRVFAMGGDAFLYDEEFAALGRLTTLTSLRLALP